MSTDWLLLETLRSERLGKLWILFSLKEPLNKLSDRVRTEVVVRKTKFWETWKTLNLIQFESATEQVVGQNENWHASKVEEEVRNMTSNPITTQIYPTKVRVAYNGYFFDLCTELVVV